MASRPGVTTAVARLALAVALVAPALAYAQPAAGRTGWDAGRLERWLDVVDRHVPGDIDSALLDATSWPRDDLHELWIEAQVLLRAVADPHENRFRIQALDPDVTSARRRRGLDPRVEMRFGPDDLKRLAGLAARVRTAGLNHVLRRAALVHTDVATLTPGRIPAPTGPISMSTPMRRSISDGRGAGAEVVSAHWDLARMLVAAVLPAPQQDRWVRDWYRATLAVAQRTESFDSIHLRHAQRLFPDDPVILFLAGCEHEAFAAPLFQEFARPLRRLGLRTGFDGAGDELDRAAALFRRALDGDPAYHEAKLHLGRVLSLRGHADAAVRELSQALRDTDDPLVEYYAALFLGAAHESAGSAAPAALAYERAAALVPHAPSPHLALARLAQRRGDRAAQVASLDRAVAIGDTALNDPWWAYRASQGRHGPVWLDTVRRTWSEGTP
jgi:hypothetical protein